MLRSILSTTRSLQGSFIRSLSINEESYNLLNSNKLEKNGRPLKSFWWNYFNNKQWFLADLQWCKILVNNRIKLLSKEISNSTNSTKNTDIQVNIFKLNK